MNASQRALALVPALLAVTGCGHLAEGTRDFVGLDEQPIRTEGHQSAENLGDQLRDARADLNQGIQDVVQISSDERRDIAAGNQRDPQRGFMGILPGAAPARVPDGPSDLVERAEVYYHLGRLTMRSQCESYMQALATVDSETTFGRDLANNFFDTATVAATISQSPVLWATGLSATQNSFNSVSGSTERFLLLSDSVGALRERVLQRMDDAVGRPPTFALTNQEVTRGFALDMARQAVEAIQRYGAPCTEGGIRQIIADALGPQIGQEATQRRNEAFVESIRGIVAKHGSYPLADRDLGLLYLYSMTRGDTTPEAQNLLAEIQLLLPYLGENGLNGTDRNLLFYNIQQIASAESSPLRNGAAALRREVLDARAARQGSAPAAPEPPPVPQTPTEGQQDEGDKDEPKPAQSGNSTPVARKTVEFKER